MSRSIRPRRRGVSLRTRMAAALALVIIAATAVLGGLIGQSSISQTRERIGQSLAADASRMAERLNNEMSARARELALLAALDPLWDLPENRPPPAASPPLPMPPGLAHMQSLLDGLKRSFGSYRWLAITDPQGRVLAATDPASLNTDISTRSAFRDGLRGRPLRDPVAPTVASRDPLAPSGPSRPAATGEADEPVMDLARPIRGTDGSVTGVILAQLGWQWIHGLARSGLTPDEQGAVRRELVLVSNQDTVLIGPPELMGARLTLPAVARARAGFYGWTVETWPDDGVFLTGAAFAAGDGGAPGAGSQELRWTVLVREPVAVAFAPAYELRRTILLVGALLAAVFAAIGWLVTGWITAPLRRIAEAAERLRTGEAVELPQLRGPAEIESLSAALRALVVTLTRKQTALAEMEELALHDPLTGLLNRNGLRVRMGRASERARDEGGRLLLFVADIDGFKSVNDTLGHAGGDALLRQAAGRLAGLMRPGDFAARVGGDEFVLALRAPGGPADATAVALAERALALVSASYDVDGYHVRIGLSLGGACWPDNSGGSDADAGLEAVLRRADSALYAVKRSGKGRLALYGHNAGLGRPERAVSG